MEYLVVKFAEQRGVVVNGAPGAWTTNEILQLQAGTYIITLAPPMDFGPPEIKVVLRNTAVVITKIILFAKVL